MQETRVTTSYTATERTAFLASFTVIILFSAIRITYLGTQNYFFSDDLLNFIIARDMGATRAYFMRDVFGQFVPLFRLGQLAYIHLFHLRFWPFVILSIGLWSTSLAIVSACAWRSRASLLIFIPVFAVLAFSPIYMESFQWWSAALSIMPSIVTGLTAIYVAGSRHHLTWTRKTVVAVCYCFGMLIYPKMLFLCILIFGVRTFIHAERGAQLKAILMQAAYDCLPLAPMVALYAFIVVSGHYTSDVKHPSLFPLMQFIWLGWNRGFVSRALGLDQLFPGAAFVANITFLGLAAVPTYFNRRLIFLWLAFFLYFAATLGVIGLNRVVPFGIESALSGRYYEDYLAFYTALLFISYGYTFGTAGALPAKRGALFVYSSITLCFASYLTVVGAHMPSPWYAGTDIVAAYINNVREALTEAPADARIANTDVPEFIMPAWMSPLTKFHYFATLFKRRAQVVTEGDANLVFQTNGHLKPIGTTQSLLHKSVFR